MFVRVGFKLPKTIRVGRRLCPIIVRWIPGYVFAMLCSFRDGMKLLKTIRVCQSYSVGHTLVLISQEPFPDQF